jgi:CMP/dCMP kinase
MKITISGMPGAGKSTVAEFLSKKLNYPRYDMGGMRRDLAKKRGLTLEQFQKLAESDPSIDLDVDNYQAEIGRREKDFVMEGRTSYHFIPDSFKIFLDCSINEGARRIYNDMKSPALREKRNEANVNNQKELEESVRRRILSDRMRYKKYYNINDFYDKSQFDYVLDTTHLKLGEASTKVLNIIQDKIVQDKLAQDKSSANN